MTIKCRHGHAVQYVAMRGWPRQEILRKNNCYKVRFSDFQFRLSHEVNVLLLQTAAAVTDELSLNLLHAEHSMVNSSSSFELEFNDWKSSQSYEKRRKKEKCSKETQDVQHVQQQQQQQPVASAGKVRSRAYSRRQNRWHFGLSYSDVKATL